MTKKLYYDDAYIQKFTATVVSLKQNGNYFDIVLDQTAFFPEEGGQSSDTGYIGDSRVSYVYEEDGIIYHRTDRNLDIGKVDCAIDFKSRFDKMQQHTAEHILCGIIHALFGYENVGFHLGDDIVTFDIDHPITREELDRVESIANDTVFQNIKVETMFPTKAELKSIKYRAKIDFYENVRIVKIGDVDSCACCAPHVNFTGEIGMIKCLDFMHHRGGTRITMCAGMRALVDYRDKYRNVREISALLSEPQTTISSALRKYMYDREKMKLDFKLVRRAYAELLANDVFADSNYVALLDHVEIDELRDFVNKAIFGVKGILVAISGEEMNYKYVIASQSIDLQSIVSDINNSICGKGGGNSKMIQGTFFASLKRIKEYFNC